MKRVLVDVSKMTQAEAWSYTCRSNGDVSMAQLAEACNVSVSTFTHAALEHPNEYSRPVLLSWVPTVTRMTGCSVMIEWLALRSGFRAPLPVGDADRLEHVTMPAAMAECADVFVAAGEAYRDGVVTDVEHRRITKEITDARRALDRMQADVDASAERTRSGRAATLADAERSGGVGVMRRGAFVREQDKG